MFFIVRVSGKNILEWEKEVIFTIKALANRELTFSLVGMYQEFIEQKRREKWA